MRDVDAEARRWLLSLDEEPAVEPRCAAWRAADPAHEAAWRRASRVWNRAADLGTLDRPDWRAEIAASSRPRRRLFPPAMASAAAAAVVLFAFVGTLWTDTAPSFATRVAETRQLALADGSHITVGPQSGLAIQYKSAARHVVLDHGEVFFEVAHDSSRPFTVQAGDAEIRVTGTKFDVRRVGGDVRVNVLEGRVEVRRRSIMSDIVPSPPDEVLTAGLSSQLASSDQTFSPPERSAVIAGEWRGGRLFYSDAPVADVLVDLARYGGLRVNADAEVAQMRVTMSFRREGADTALDDLATTLPLVKRREKDGSITLARRPAA